MKFINRSFNMLLMLAFMAALVGVPPGPVAAASLPEPALSGMAALQASCLDGGRGFMAREDQFTGYSQFIRTGRRESGRVIVIIGGKVEGGIHLIKRDRHIPTVSIDEDVLAHHV